MSGIHTTIHPKPGKLCQWCGKPRKIVLYRRGDLMPTPCCKWCKELALACGKYRYMR